MHLEQALQRPRYQRAWMCRTQGEPRFMLLETIDNKAQTIDLPGGAPLAGAEARFFEAKGSASQPQMGRALKGDDVASSTEFIAVLPHAKPGPVWVNQRVLSSFRYRYRDDGRLASVTITNPDGKISVLDY
jgi:hypothetical protein